MRCVLSERCTRFIHSTVALLALACAAGATDRYVATNSIPTPPYTSWATAASTIQDAVDIAVNDDVIWVSNGVYSTGGAIDPDGLSNRVAIVNKDIYLRSVNGPEHTIIVGGGSVGPSAVRCLYSRDATPMNTTIEGFTLRDGRTHSSGSNNERSGGGVFTYDSTIQNCVIHNCEASMRGGGVFFPYSGAALFDSVVSNNVAGERGGGVFAGTTGSVINRCTIAGNASGAGGGGIHLRQGSGGSLGVILCNTLIAGNTTTTQGGGLECWDAGMILNCTIVSNSAPFYGAGGLRLYGGGNVKNCIIYNNIGTNGLPQYYNMDIQYTNVNHTMEYSCTYPMPTDPQVITATMTTNNPAFIDPAADWRLSLGSPCVDTGTNFSWNNEIDLLQTPHQLDGNNDSINTYDMGCYEFVHPTADTDGDSMSDADELVAGTSATNISQKFTLNSIVPTGDDMVIGWDSLSSRTYTMYWSTNLMEGWTNDPAFTGVTGADGPLSYTNSTGITPMYFRVSVTN